MKSFRFSYTALEYTTYAGYIEAKNRKEALAKVLEDPHNLEAEDKGFVGPPPGFPASGEILGTVQIDGYLKRTSKTGGTPVEYKAPYLEPASKPAELKEPSDNDAPDGFDYWGDEHPEFPIADWLTEARNNDTRLGYWAWVRQQIR